MDTINGATIIPPDPEGLVAEIARGPITLGANQTANAYVALVGVVPTDTPVPPLHQHPYTDEGFYIAEGEITFQIGNREVIAGPGTFVYIPRGTVHTARMSGKVPMRGMLILSPGNAEHVFVPVEAESGSGERDTLASGSPAPPTST